MNGRILVGIPLTLLLTWLAAPPAAAQTSVAHAPPDSRNDPPIERLARLEVEEIPLAVALPRLSDASDVTSAFSPGPLAAVRAHAPARLSSTIPMQGTVSGRVTAVDTGQPLPLVQVQVVGTTFGGLTNAEGRFSIANVPAGQFEIQAQMLGYATTSQTVTVLSGGVATVDFQLPRDVLALDAVVVTAFGIERAARSLSYSTQGLDTAPLTQARELNVVNSLQGKVAGLNISQGATGVGSASRVILRGNRSISGASEPLIVLDGMPIRGNNSDINPDDIASIDVLKGPNGAAL